MAMINLLKIRTSIDIFKKEKCKATFGLEYISTYDFSTLYTMIPQDLIKNQLVDLIDNTFRCEEVLNLACNEE